MIKSCMAAWLSARVLVFGDQRTHPTQSERSRALAPTFLFWRTRSWRLAFLRRSGVAQHINALTDGICTGVSFGTGEVPWLVPVCEAEPWPCDAEAWREPSRRISSFFRKS